ncbi:hypothetical protein RFI_20705 [Reticulomyxa filosa]|uniref:Transmembrane protein n=1 Tax=Reticulomyxa filosa TaxID=46433 RepID=X6MU36_RETFI|nr:hypothetical protein RFI_20705 [Reticulomyxa filosa]|eukprot:ETO16635.1 hypothetical protein RFI_20705 [Reticulomyxa filosa]
MRKASKFVVLMKDVRGLGAFIHIQFETIKVPNLQNIDSINIHIWLLKTQTGTGKCKTKSMLKKKVEHMSLAFFQKKKNDFAQLAVFFCLCAFFLFITRSHLIFGSFFLKTKKKHTQTNCKLEGSEPELGTEKRSSINTQNNSCEIIDI